MKSMKKDSGLLSGFCHGITTIGERGQIVIPQEARTKLRIKQKDKFFVFSRFGQVLILIKENELQNFLSAMIPLGIPKGIFKSIKKTAQKKLKK